MQRHPLITHTGLRYSPSTVFIDRLQSSAFSAFQPFMMQQQILALLQAQVIDNHFLITVRDSPVTVSSSFDFSCNLPSPSLQPQWTLRSSVIHPPLIPNQWTLWSVDLWSLDRSLSSIFQLDPVTIVAPPQMSLLATAQVRLSFNNQWIIGQFESVNIPPPPPLLNLVLKEELWVHILHNSFDRWSYRNSTVIWIPISFQIACLLGVSFIHSEQSEKEGIWGTR